MGAWLIDWARKHWRPRRGAFLVVVDQEGDIRSLELEDIKKAKGYADDVVSEFSPPYTIAVVLNDELQIVHRGIHYASKPP